MQFLVTKKVMGNDAGTDYEKPEGTTFGSAPRCPKCQTERVQKLAADFGLKNVNLTPVEGYVWDPLWKLHSGSLKP